MLDRLEVLFEQRQQIGIGPAREHLRHERAAFFQRFDREPRPRFDQPHGAQVIGLFVADRVRGHIRQHQIGRPAQSLLQRGGSSIIHKVHLENGDALDRFDFEQVYAHDLGLGRLLAHHLRPPARRDPQIDHALGPADQAEFLVQFDELVCRAAAIAIGLGLLDVGVVQLPFEPAHL